MDITGLLKDLGVDLAPHAGQGLMAVTPIDGSVLAHLKTDDAAVVEMKIVAASQAFEPWRLVPAPKRGELIRLFGEELRRAKADLGKLVSIECGKILPEGLGEVQEMIDICDFATGLSRQLYGLTIVSERSNHAITETWHPLGVVAVISAFNFPVAVWAWNTALAVVCGNPVIWKPSDKTPLCALACQALFDKAIRRFVNEGGHVPPQLSQLVIGGAALGAQLAASPAIPLVSATGSTRMGRALAPVVAARFGRSLLELGGNNAVIVSNKADLTLALDSILFGAVGTAGQRCTTTRRVIVHRAIYDGFFDKLHKQYAALDAKIGDPLQPATLIGPLIGKDSFNAMQESLQAAAAQGGSVSFGQRILQDKYPAAFYVMPALVKMPAQSAIVRQETFAPILYVMPYDHFAEALAMQNDVPQGLSSAIFTTDLREAELFRAASDCGIANVNIGTSGAEIGGAFGGEKETGGGRESGSDSWKNYMRRQTSTVFYGSGKPELAQGINFNAG